ncbi:MAG: DUF1080 domain-containing protein [Gemmataceae bacterium]
MAKQWFLALALAVFGGLNAIGQDNQLSPREKSEGWVLLFDGNTTRGWMTPKGKPLPVSHVQDGALNPHPTDYMLTHETPRGDFVLSLDFKISPKCNSGVFIRTSPLEPRPGKDVGFNGLEVAIDDTTTAGYHDTGALYDLAKPDRNAMKPAGEWNHLTLTCLGPKITVEVNGAVVNTINLDQFDKVGLRPDGTAHKFGNAAKTHPRAGHIGLQDHGSDCWYKNIKLKPLADAP